jgi:hypothetical protein
MIGDHIRARKGGGWDHAIDCGDQTVIHLVADPSVPSSDRVRRSYRPVFLSGADRVEVVTHRERVFAPRQVVARAYSRAKETALAGMFRDASEFASWCKTGRVNGAVHEVPAVAAFPPVRSVAARPPAAKPRAAAKAAAPAKTRTTATAKARPAVTAKTGPTAIAKARASAKPTAKTQATKASKAAPKKKAAPARAPKAKRAVARRTPVKAAPRRAAPAAKKRATPRRPARSAARRR